MCEIEDTKECSAEDVEKFKALFQFPINDSAVLVQFNKELEANAAYKQFVVGLLCFFVIYLSNETLHCRLTDIRK